MIAPGPRPAPLPAPRALRALAALLAAVLVLAPVLQLQPRAGGRADSAEGMAAPAPVALEVLRRLDVASPGGDPLTRLTAALQHRARAAAATSGALLADLEPVPPRRAERRYLQLGRLLLDGG